MENVAKCPHCGAELPEDAPKGLCPKCLMANALEETETRGASYVRTIADDPDATRPSLVSVGDLQSDIPAAPEPAGKYSILGEHGKGGMGRVLLVHDEHLGRDIALKELLPDLGDGSTPTPARHSKEMAARFLREAKITGQLEHPSITPVHEIGRKADGTLYYTMKLVRGRTLSQAIKSAKNFEERLNLLPHFVDLCNAIAYAHSRGVIHRDIKPSNVMIGDYGETVIIDWGLAKIKSEIKPAGGPSTPGQKTIMGVRARTTLDDDSGKTQHGQAMGTPAYMSPEQATGDLDNIDERSDIYSLGAVLFEILTGQPPVEGKSVAEILRNVIAGKQKRVRDLEAKCEKTLASIAQKSLEVNPGDRYEQAAELGVQIQDWKPEPKGALVRRIIKYSSVISPIVFLVFTLVADKYYSHKVEVLNEDIGKNGGALSVGDFKSPRESESRSKNYGDVLVQDTLNSMPYVYYVGSYQGRKTIDPILDLGPKLTDEMREEANRILLTYSTMMEHLESVVGSPPDKHSDGNGGILGVGDYLRYIGFYKYTPQLFKLRAAIAWKEGRFSEAVDDLLTIHSLSLHLKDSHEVWPIRFGYEISRFAGLHELDAWFSEGIPPLEEIQRLRSFLVSANDGSKQPNIFAAMRREGFIQFRAFDRGDWRRYLNLGLDDRAVLSIFHSTKLLRWRRRRDESLYLSLLQKAMELSSEPYYLSRAGYEDIEYVAEHATRTNPVTFTYLREVVGTGDAIAASRTDFDIAITSLALLEHILEQGRLPDSLEELMPKYLESVPIDEFCGKPIQYHLQENGFVVYSVGFNELDDGGQVREKASYGEGDIGWQITLGGTN